MEGNARTTAKVLQTAHNLTAAVANNGTSHSGFIQFNYVAGVVASAVFRTNSCRLLTYEEMQPAKIDAIGCKKYPPGPSGLCATAVREEEEEEEEEEEGGNDTWVMSRVLSTCRRTFTGK